MPGIMGMLGDHLGFRHQEVHGERTGYHDPHNVWGGANMWGFNSPQGGRGGHRFARMGPFPGNGGFGWGVGPQTYDPSAFLNQGFGLYGHGAYHPGGFGGFGGYDRYNRYGGHPGGADHHGRIPGGYQHPGGYAHPATRRR